MRNTILLALLLLCSAQLTNAQDDESKVEVFGGYSFLAAESRITNDDISTFGRFTPAQIRILTGFDLTSTDRRKQMHGFETSVTGYFTKRVGLTGDFSGHYRSEPQDIGDTEFQAKASIYNFLGGPHVRLPNKSRVTPFVHALFGAARVRTEFSENSNSNPTTATDSSTRFAMAFGGGLDFRASERVSLRLFQIDYNPILGKDRRVTASDSTIIDLQGRTQHNVRFSIGIVFH